MNDSNSRLPQIISSSIDAYDYFKPLSESYQETMAALFLTTRNEVISFEIVFKGTIDHASVSPREILKLALDMNAARVIVAHNHPSGHCDPSREDIDFTCRLIVSGEIVGVSILDHLIVAESKEYYSFADAGKMTNPPYARRWPFGKTRRSRSRSHPFRYLRNTAKHH